MSSLGILIIIAIIAGLAIILIGIQWLIPSFKAFKTLNEIKRDIQHIYYIIKEKKE
ncbi:hypothetical protein ACFLSQ_07275 [Bacteroidota bacterium]